MNLYGNLHMKTNDQSAASYNKRVKSVELEIKHKFQSKLLLLTLQVTHTPHADYLHVPVQWHRPFLSVSASPQGFEDQPNPLSSDENGCHAQASSQDGRLRLAARWPPQLCQLGSWWRTRGCPGAQREFYSPNLL